MAYGYWNDVVLYLDHLVRVLVGDYSVLEEKSYVLKAGQEEPEQVRLV